MKRGAIKKSESKLVNIWIPAQLLEVLDQAVVQSDLDRAKWVRQAIREKIQRKETAR